MTPAALPLVLVWNERAVCHAVDASAPAGALRDLFAWYFAPENLPSGALVWRQGATRHLLDPGTAIGLQVPADAEIDFAVDALAEGPDLSQFMAG